MSILRYTASADTTIANAFKSDLINRATGSNMGRADVLESFSLYGQVSSSASGVSSELSRILVNFPVTSISADRSAGTIPASGSVSFFLRMFNAKHVYTLPRNYTMTVSAVSRSWEEGNGTDMERYKDITHDGVGANWLAGAGTAVAATATVTWYAGDRPESGDTITIIDAAGLSKTYIAAASQDLTADPPKWHASNTTTTQVDSLQSCIESANGHNGSITVSQDATGLIMTLASSTTGTPGNTTITVAGATSGQISATNFSGGLSYTSWTTAGGDYHTAAYNPGTTMPAYTVSFDGGTEDIELDITSMVEEWIIGTYTHRTNYGIGLAMASSLEAATRSYYTKKFFARSSQFFYKRPYIEARWDSAKKDDRGNFYSSSSLAPATDNLNTLYLYNYVRGNLTNIPDVSNGAIYVRAYSAESSGTVIVSTPQSPVTGGHVSTGIYSASFALDTTASTVYDRWYSYSLTSSYHTGTVEVKSLSSAVANISTEYTTTITNLKPIYSRNETARFRTYVREKDWSPTIYTVANATVQNVTVESGSYRIFRVSDNLDVIPFGTGSTLHTQVSFDVTGSYFDLNMALLEPEYAYGVQLAYYNGAVGSWVEQPEIFKFRVE